MLKEDYLKKEREADKKRYNPDWYWDTWSNEWIFKDDIVQMAKDSFGFKCDYEAGRWGKLKTFSDLTDNEIFNLYANKFQYGRFVESDDVVGDSITKELTTPNGDIVVAVSQYISE